jgi:hypothetical protein
MSGTSTVVSATPRLVRSANCFPPWWSMHSSCHRHPS